MHNIIKKAISAILKKKCKKNSKKCNLVPENSAPEEDGCTYVIDRLNLGVAKNDPESDSNWILAQFSTRQMSYNRIKNNY